jgi:PAS domain S-box-containing protein
MAEREKGEVEKPEPQGMPVPGFLGSLTSVPKAAGAIAIIVGCLVLVGWTLDIDVLKRLLPGLVAMNPITAITFILAGISLLLLRDEDVDQRLRRIAQWCSSAVALIGLLKLIGVLFGWEIGTDHLLFPESLELETAVNGIPNQMAPNTALNFLLLGCAVLILDRQTRHGRWPAQYLILAVLTASLIPIIGYTFGVEYFYSITPYTPMALHTALTFVVLSVGLLCARPYRGLMSVVTSDSTGGTVARRLLPAIVLIPIVAGWLRLKGQQAGLYESEFGVVLMVLSSIIILAAVVWWTTRLLYRTDVERKQAEETLRKSEARNRAVVDTATDAIITMTTDGLIRSFNPGAEHIFGYTAKEAIGQPLRMLMPERFRDPHEAGFRRYLETDEAHVVGKGPVELAGLRKGREEFPLELSLGEMRERDDIMFTGIIRDITERKRTEEEHYRLAAIVEASHDAILSKTLDGIITSWNPGAENLYGYSADEVIGHPISILVPPDRPQEISEILARIKRGEGIDQYETVRVTKDGRRLDVSIAISLIKDSTGNVIGASTIARDITQRKRAEEALRKETDIVQLLKMVALTANEALSLEEAC